AVPGGAAGLARAVRHRSRRRQGDATVNEWLKHLPILPVAVPLMVGAAMLLLNDSHRRARLVLSSLSILTQIFLAVTLLRMTAGYVPTDWPGGVGVYLLGDWPAPFGIVAVVDRLSTIMLLLTAV